jgi:hypothetical protein
MNSGRVIARILFIEIVGQRIIKGWCDRVSNE